MRPDLRLALRRLARQPGLAIAAVLTLAVGIGACTAMFSVVQAVLLKSMAVAAPDRLVVLWPQLGDTAGEFAYNRAAELARQSASFEAIAVTGSTNWPVPVDILLPGGRHTRATQSAVSATFFEVLGARPLIGRTFRPDDDRPGAPPAIVVSSAFWTRQLNRDPNMIDRTLTIGADTWRIVGVMPPEFFYPAGADFWTPAATLLAMTSPDKSPAALAQLLDSVGAFHVVARLKPGVSMSRAQADATRVWKGSSAAVASDASARVGGRAFLDHVFGSARRALWLLLASVLLVLLIACANVAGLLMASNARRSREVAVRRALGARPWQLVRQSVIEAGVLAVCGGALGLAIAASALRALIALSPATVVRLSDTHIDVGVLVMSFLVTVAVTVMVGVVPALQSRRSPVESAMNGLSTREAGAVVRARTRDLLVVAQVAITMTLLVAGALAGQSFLRLEALDLGFTPANVLTFDISRLDQSRYSTSAVRHRVVDDLVATIRHLPDVRSAAAVLSRPFAHGVIGWDSGLLLEGQPDVETTWLRNPIVNFEAVTPGYFESMGIGLPVGRDFSGTDRAGAPLAAIVSDNLAARLWPGQNPLGKRLLDSFVGRGKDGRPSRWLTVIGVAGAARYRELDRARFDFYIPLAQAEDFDAEHIVIRTAGDPRSLVPQVAATLTRVDPQLSAADVTTMEEIVGRVRAPWRFNMLLSSAFGAISVGLTAIGIVGLVVSTVNWRRREIGVRLALGAQAHQVVSMIALEGARFIGLGVAIGVVASLLVARLISSLLFGVAPNDARTLAAVGGAVFLLGVVACYLPARRAATLDPSVAFREE